MRCNRIYTASCQPPLRNMCSRNSVRYCGRRSLLTKRRTNPLFPSAASQSHLKRILYGGLTRARTVGGIGVDQTLLKIPPLNLKWHQAFYALYTPTAKRFWLSISECPSLKYPRFQRRRTICEITRNLTKVITVHFMSSPAFLSQHLAFALYLSTPKYL